MDLPLKKLSFNKSAAYRSFLKFSVIQGKGRVEDPLYWGSRGMLTPGLPPGRLPGLSSTPDASGPHMMQNVQVKLESVWTPVLSTFTDIFMYARRWRGVFP